MAELKLPENNRAFGSRKLVRDASGKRKGNILAPDRSAVRDAEAPTATPEQSNPVATDIVAVTIKQLAIAGGATKESQP